MGTLVKLDQTFTGYNLPKLVDYDVSDLLSRLKALPTMWAMYDFTDPSTMTLNGSLVEAVTDLSGNGNTLTAAGTDRPSYNSAALGVAGGIVFNGNKLQAANLFAGSDRLSMSALVYATGDDGTSRIFLSDASDGGANFYHGGNVFRLWSADIQRSAPNLSTTLYHAKAATDFVTDAASLYTQTGVTTGTTTRAKPSGAGNVGAWNDAVSTNRYIGALGHLFVLNEDLQVNDAVRAMIDDYAARKYRL